MTTFKNKPYEKSLEDFNRRMDLLIHLLTNSCDEEERQELFEELNDLIDEYKIK